MFTGMNINWPVTDTHHQDPPACPRCPGGALPARVRGCLLRHRHEGPGHQPRLPAGGQGLRRLDDQLQGEQILQESHGHSYASLESLSHVSLRPSTRVRMWASSGGSAGGRWVSGTFPPSWTTFSGIPVTRSERVVMHESCIKLLTAQPPDPGSRPGPDLPLRCAAHPASLLSPDLPGERHVAHRLHRPHPGHALARH